MANIVEDFNKKQLKRINQLRNIKIPDIRIADTVEVKYKINEESDARVQSFTGLVIARSKSLNNYSATFTVRKISSLIGVERKFTLYSPLITSITILKRGVVKRAKLYYIRDLTGKASRIKEKMDLDKNSFVVDSQDSSSLRDQDNGKQDQIANHEQVLEESNLVKDSNPKVQEKSDVQADSMEVNNPVMEGSKKS